MKEQEKNITKETPKKKLNVEITFNKNGKSFQEIMEEILTNKIIHK